MFFERYTEERVEEVIWVKDEAFVTFIETEGAEKALDVPKIMVGQQITVQLVDSSEQKNSSMQKDDKTFSKKVCCDSCKKEIDEADKMRLVCGHFRPCRGCSRKWDRACISCGVITVSCDVCKNDTNKDDTFPLVCCHQRVCGECRGKWDCTCSWCFRTTVSCDMCKGNFDEEDIVPLVCGHQRLCQLCSRKMNCTCSLCGVTTVSCEMCKSKFEKDATVPLACGHQRVCHMCSGNRVCTCSSCGVTTVSCVMCKTYFDKVDTLSLVCGHQRVCRGCSRKQDCTCSLCGMTEVRCNMCKKCFNKADMDTLICGHQYVCHVCSDNRECKCSSCSVITVRCVTCKKCFVKTDTEPLVCGHKTVCRGCNSTHDYLTCTICGENTVRCLTCKKGFEEAGTEPLLCGHLSICCGCSSTHDCLTCSICGETAFRCVNCKKSFEEAGMKPLVCGHVSVCFVCNRTQDCKTCTICGEKTVYCVSCTRSFEESDTEPLVCGHQSVCRECYSKQDIFLCTTCGKRTVRCVICGKYFEEADTELLICGHKAICRTCYSTQDYSSCSICGNVTVRCAACKKYFEETDIESLACGHLSFCRVCISTLDFSTCSICGINTGIDSALSANIGAVGHQETVTKPKTAQQHVDAPFPTGDEISVVSVTDLKEPVHCGPIEEKKGILGLFKTRWCVIQNGTFFIFHKQFDRKQKKAFKLSGYKFRNAPNLSRAKEEKGLCFELFREDSKQIYKFKALSREDYQQWQRCIANGGYPLTGNSSFRDTDVNPNKQQTDRRYQRFHTFKQDEMKFTYERPIYVREKSDNWIFDVTGIEIIPDDRMVVCDNNNMSVKLIDTTQNIVTSSIYLHPFGIALVPRDVTKITKKSTTHDLVVTLPRKEQLRYIRVTNDQITDTNKVISVKGWCLGIRVIGDRKLAIGYGYPGRVEIRDLEGQLLTTIVTDNGGARLFSSPWYLAVSPGSDILYVSDRWNDTLTSISTRDWSVLTKLKGLNYPRGVTVDRAGSVFVCCGDRTVQLVAATGDRATRILGKEDGLCESPLAICLSPEGDRMYVSCKGSVHVQEFRLTEKDN